jgi:hypothetical protein
MLSRSRRGPRRRWRRFRPDVRPDAIPDRSRSSIATDRCREGFLTQRGLARLCGIQNAHIGTIGTEWDEEIQKPRISTIKGLLSARGQTPAAPYFDVSDEKRQIYAYPDYVCLAILEYYAFEAGTNVKPEAVQNFRQLAGMALREFIYTQLGYSPAARVPDSWSLFHDRVSLVFHTVPHGYFSIFKEMSDIIVTLIRQGASIDDKFIPDISVGQHWANHWRDSDLEIVHGERIQYEHIRIHHSSKEVVLSRRPSVAAGFDHLILFPLRLRLLGPYDLQPVGPSSDR